LKLPKALPWFNQRPTIFRGGPAIPASLLLRGKVANDGIGHGSTPEASLMEFIRVLVKDQPTLQTDVLINGQRNGTTGELITLGSPGWKFISVDLPAARQQNVNVKNTTPTRPMQIEIDCDEGISSMRGGTD
jgi:hypothetical protein